MSFQVSDSKYLEYREKFRKLRTAVTQLLTASAGIVVSSVTWLPLFSSGDHIIKGFVVAVVD